MNKARNIIVATVGAVLLAGTVTATSAAIRAGGGIIPTVFANNDSNQSKTITLDASKVPTIVDGSGTLTYNDYASFAYTKASDPENGQHVALDAGGTIIKNEASNGLISFKVIFDGDLTLTTGYGNSDDVCYSYALTSNVLQEEVHGNYFKLQTTGGADITEIQIVFGCSPTSEENEAEHSWSSEEWAYNETHHWHACTDDHCVRRNDEAEHSPVNVAQVDPTESQTGLTAGTVCSVCDAVLSGRRILPVLDEINYDLINRTTKVGNVVADFDQYTWKEDDSVVIYANQGDALVDYIHAGNSYYSIETWNDMFKNQEAVVSGNGDNRTLTITLKGGETTVLAEDRVSDLDGTFDLLLYKNVNIQGDGTLNIAYTEDQDGIICYNLTVGENVTLNLTGNDATKKTGISFAGTLQIDGTYNVSKFANGIGINTNNELIPGCSTATDLITVNGKLSIKNCNAGIHSWNTPSGGATIAFNGDVDITNVASAGIYLESAVTVNFNGGTVDIDSNTNGIAAKYMAFNFNSSVDVHITAEEIGINLILTNPDQDANKLTMNNNAKLTIVSTNGSGIYCNGGGVFLILDNSKLDITAASSGIYNFKQFRAYNGGKSVETMNTASVIIKTGGVTGNTGGKTPTVYGIYGRDTYSFVDVGFRTTGEVLIENTGTKGGTGIYFGKTTKTNNGKDKNGNIVIYGCTNFTIKNFSTAVGMNTSSQEPSLIKYGGVTGFNDSVKIKVVDCTTVVSGPTGTWFTNHFSDNKFIVSSTNQ